MAGEVIPFEDIKKMADVLGRLGMFKMKPEEMLPLMLIAQAEGKHPAIVAQEYDIIQGKPALNSRAALARFQSAGGRIDWIERTDTLASAKFSHPLGGSLTITWDWARATAAGLVGKDNWKKYPAQMLSARVIAEGVRAVFPGCLSGFYTSDEVRDFVPPESEERAAEARNVTPEPEPDSKSIQAESATTPRQTAIVAIDEIKDQLTAEQLAEVRNMLRVAGDNVGALLDATDRALQMARENIGGDAEPTEPREELGLF